MSKGKPVNESSAQAVRALSLIMADIDFEFSDADFEWCEYVDLELAELDLEPVTGVVIIDVDSNALIIADGGDTIILESIHHNNTFKFTSDTKYEYRAKFVFDIIRIFLRHDVKLSPVANLRKLIE